ncbi:unnamed protein product [Meganyctiphanes norvegica]|uniref:Uncharacterized protein n=1 Tax=Meganyctiphanes norvegica TaxID=48144 RepID=A0AAV2QHP6_MEGNR
MLTEVISKVFSALGNMWEAHGDDELDMDAPRVDHAQHRWHNTDLAQLHSVICLPPSPTSRNSPQNTFTNLKSDITSTSQDCDVVRAGIPCCYMEDEGLGGSGAPETPTPSSVVHLQLPFTELRCDSDNDSGLVSCGDSDHANTQGDAMSTSRSLPPYCDIGDAPVVCSAPGRGDSPVPYRPDMGGDSPVPAWMSHQRGSPDSPPSFSSRHHANLRPSPNPRRDHFKLSDSVVVDVFSDPSPSVGNNSNEVAGAVGHQRPGTPGYQRPDTPGFLQLQQEQSPNSTLVKSPGCDNSLSNSSSIKAKKRYDVVKECDEDEPQDKSFQDFDYPPPEKIRENPFTDGFRRAASANNARKYKTKVGTILIASHVKYLPGF